MNVSLKLLSLFIAVFLLASCSKEEQDTQTDKKQTEEDNPSDTNLTPEEKFSASILVDFLNDSDDDDLASFLETEVYKTGKNYNGTSVVELTPSTWLVGFEKDSTVKNYILQKYVDPKTNDYYFTFKETTLTIPDVISLKRPKESAGEQ
jgi:hypothetical protein